jgi:hypothetical protein
MNGRSRPKCPIKTDIRLACDPQDSNRDIRKADNKPVDHHIAGDRLMCDRIDCRHL